MLSSNGEGISFAAEEEIRQALDAGMDEDDLEMLRLEKEQGASNARRLARRHLKKQSERHGAASNPLAVNCNSLLPMASPVLPSSKPDSTGVTTAAIDSGGEGGAPTPSRATRRGRGWPPCTVGHDWLSQARTAD